MTTYQLKHKAERYRWYYQKGQLSPHQIRSLDSLGFVWDMRDFQWEQRYAELVTFREANGHCNVTITNGKLGAWVGTQRNFYKLGTLSQDRIDKLNDIGFMWQPFDSVWNEYYDKLVEFKKANGHCNVPYHNKELGNWVMIQRQFNNKNRMPQDRIDKLNVIGFIWDLRDSNWNDNYDKLIEFKKANSHCNVPRNTELAKWVKTQRRFYATDRLPKDRIDKLNEISFDWHILESWEQRYAELIKFKMANGHCNVPTTKNRKLATWVMGQRDFYRDDKMPQDRIDKLNAIGFVWNTCDAKWNKQYDKLVEFKKANGHCNVPQSNNILGQWVNNQRQRHKKAKLSENRIKRLNKIGFDWKLQ